MVWTLFFTLLLHHAVASTWDDSGFLNWFQDSLDEKADVPLQFEGKVPSYVSGTFVQAGPGRFTMGGMKVGHAFDGFSKVNNIAFSKGEAKFSSFFLKSAFLNNSLKSGKVAPALTLGETTPPSRTSHGPLNALGANDNNYVKAVKFGDVELLASDTVIASKMSGHYTHLDYSISPLMSNLAETKHWTDLDVAPSEHICVMGTLAHGHTDPVTGVFTGAMACMSPVGPLLSDYHIVFTIDPAEPERRHLLSRIQLPHGRGTSYMHAMGVTSNHVVLIAEPLHMSMTDTLMGKPLGEGALVLGNETLFQVVNRINGSVRIFTAPSFLFGHVLNAWEEGDDILLDLTWYSMESYSFFRLFLFKNLENKEVRDHWPLNQIVRFRLRPDGSVESTQLLKEEPNTAFELPKINPTFNAQKYCVFYGWQSHAYRYDLDQSSKEAGPFAAAAVGKRNICTGERRGFYRPNEYPAEHEFIPDPEGQDEDEGSLVGLVFDANTNTSYLQILDGQTMMQVAKAPLPVRVPFPVHTSFFPEGTGAVDEVVNLI